VVGASLSPYHSIPLLDDEVIPESVMREVRARTLAEGARDVGK
jgi:hypothetical protein